MMILKRLMMALVFPAVCLAGPELILVENGTPRMVVVVADDATRTATYAAEEFVEHVRQATGANMPVVAESDIPDGYAGCVFIGETQAALAQGMDPETMAHDEFVLRTVGRDLYVLGREDPERDRVITGPPEGRVLHGGFSSNDATAPAGTLFGVYEALQRFVGVRWLWPGALGTYVPPSDTVTAPALLDERHPPKLGFRRYAWYQIQRAGDAAERGDYQPEIEGLSFSADVIQAYRDDLSVFLGRHRLGYSKPKPRTTHYFSGWWPRHGDRHPEWFMMNEDGQRGYVEGRTPDKRHIAMCVSNPDLHRYLVEEAWNGGEYLTLGEVDVRHFCQCEECRAWDEPLPENLHSGVRRFYEPLVSDRYARFWKTIQEMASRKNPEVTVTTYLYWNYLPAPVGDIDLGKRVYGEFVPWNGPTTYYPMPEEMDAWLRAQWLGWARTGIRMAYRPNIFHCGYVMPHISTRQAGEFFKFAYENGMEGFRFDSLLAHWATKGPMLYMYMRLAWDPEIDIEQIRQEYFSAFGPAAEAVERYFDFWEEYSHVRPGGSLISPVHSHLAYPPEILAKGAAMLDEALSAARAHPRVDYAERVAFLQAGLEHARLSAQFMRATDSGNIPVHDPERFLAARRAFDALTGFRREHEHLYIADLRDAARRENRRIDFDLLLQDVEEVVRPDIVSDPWGEWTFRADPDDRGLREKWYRTENPVPAWEPIDVPAFWAATEVGDYLGYGWYRTTFPAPPVEEDQAWAIRFEGVDEQAWVFVNGHYVGEHSEESEQRTAGELWNEPFTIPLDARHLNPDAENVLVVRVHASVSNGGIWRPVYLYRRAKP